MERIMYGHKAKCIRCGKEQKFENADGSIPLSDALFFARRAGWITGFDGVKWHYICPVCAKTAQFKLELVA